MLQCMKDCHILLYFKNTVKQEWKSSLKSFQAQCVTDTAFISGFSIRSSCHRGKCKHGVEGDVLKWFHSFLLSLGELKQ